MKIKHYLFAPVVVATILACAVEAPQSTAFAEEGKSEDQKVLFALGMAISQQISAFQLSEDELGEVLSGLQAGVLGKETDIDLQAYMPKVQQLAQSRQAKVAEAEAGESAKFLATRAAEEGATTTASGLIYKEVVAGTGDSPAAEDRVKVHYHGTLRSGQVFDSSVDRGEPATFGLNQVIKCWTEGVQLMKVGGKSQLTCPAEIAYGDRGAPPKIAPGAALVFEVELLEIIK